MHRYAFSEIEFCQLKHLKEITAFSRSDSFLLFSFTLLTQQMQSIKKPSKRQKVITLFLRSDASLRVHTTSPKAYIFTRVQGLNTYV